MKKTSTNSGGALNKYLVLIQTVLVFLLNQVQSFGFKKIAYSAIFRLGLKTLVVCLAFFLSPGIANADTPIPTGIVTNYNAALQRLTMNVNWYWSSQASNKIIGAAVFADLNGDGIIPSLSDNPNTYTSGGNPFPAGLQARDEFLGQLAISNIEGSATSSMFPAIIDNTDNGIASGVPGVTLTTARVLFPYGVNAIEVVNASANNNGSFTMIFNNLNISPTKICVILYDVHPPLTSSGGHSVVSAGPDYNTDNSLESGNTQGTVSCNGLVSLNCAINKTEGPCQTQAAINASYAAWIASVTAFGCNGVLTNNSSGAPSASGGSKTVTFTYTQNQCSNQAAVTTCSATFTVLACPNSIGDRVWLDADADGLQDASETAGFSGATVQLRNSSNTVIATQITDAAGYYLFTGLAAGTYTVVFPLSISGAVLTTANVGTNDDIDSDPSQTTGITPNIILATGQSIVNVDAGYIPTTLQLGNRVFSDLNNNGIDNTEPGISGSTVNLYKDNNNDNVPDGASIATVTTNATGNYTFTNLSPGNYIVGIVTPAGYVSSAVNGGDPDNNTDLDDNGQVISGAETRGLSITLVAGTEPNGDINNTYDFGFYSNIPFTGERCFVSPTVPATVWAKSTWTINPANQTVTIRTTFSKTFVDNTYGTNAIGWPGGHSFGNLTGSDKLGWSIKDANGVVKLAFEQDYISSSASFPSGYGTLGFGGDGGNPTVGSTTDVTAFLSSIDKNLNQNGASYYNVITNSPATDNNYTPNATYPNWIYDVWYEVTVKLSAFGAAGFGYPDIATVHASPSKTGNNTEVVNPTGCIGSIGDYVWTDNNGNGIQDAGENGIQGVTVTLTKPDATTVTTVTNASGLYQFTNLTAGTYAVSFPTTLAGGFGLTTANVGTDDSKDSDPAQGTGIAAGVVLYPGQNNTTVDAGYVLSNLTLGNKVFFDLNRSGMYEATDSVSSGIIVRLYADANNDNIPDGALIQAMTTNALGEYSFTNLAPGNYIVGAVIPPVHAVTVTNGGDPDNNIDNDNNAIDNVSGEARGNSISLASGTEPTAGNTNNTYDIGFYNPTLPPNGGQNCFAGTNPLVYAKSYWNVNANSQTVTLRVTFSKQFVDNTYGTGAIGWPNGHTFGNLTGSDHLQWSIRDANGVEKLAFKQDYVSASAAFPSGYGCLGFGGDGGTPTVGLATDVLSFRTSIAANFNDFGYVLTTNSPATDTFYTPNPSQPNWIYDVWYEVTVKASIFGTPGFGFVNVASVHASPSKTGNNTEIITNTPCVSSIGDRVWYDTDRDGIQDAGENGIRGVTVKLRNAANTVIATQVTNTTGNYLFTGLSAGTYTVEFPATVYGYILSPAYVGTNRNIDSDPSVTTGITPSIVLGTADDNRTIDAGYAPVCCTNSAGNLLVNGSFENGVTGWSWSAANGSLTTGTGYIACGSANGFNNWSSGTSKVWQDVNVAAGSTVSFSAFAGTHAPGIACSPKISLIFLNSANAVISQIDSIVKRVVGDYNDQLEQYPITAVAPAGTVKVRVQSTITCSTMKLDEFCLTVTAPPVGSIGDRVWKDTDGDGIQDAGEVGVAGITLVLLNSAGQPIATTTTDAFGNYKFSGLPAGNYSVRVTPPANYSLSPKTQGADTNVDSDFDPITYTTGTVTLAAGQNRTDIDAGLKFTQLQPASVGDRVWLDNNGDGVQDAGEPGVSNVLVTLYNSVVTAVRFTYTDVNGNYLFTDVAPGTYTVGVSLPPAFVFSPNNGAITDATNSDIIPATGRTASFTVNAGDQIRYVDAGLKKQIITNGSIGDYVWNDLNKNGIQEAGEPGIAGVTIRLVNATTNAIIATTTTDATGKYIFNDVPAGNYLVDFVTPAGYTITTKLNSNVAASGTDSDVDPATSRTATFALAAGQRITTVDAGYWKTTIDSGKIGDRVWQDDNQNGIQDPGEVNQQGVTVTLYDAANTAIKLVVTDANGNYLFTNLAAGNYTVGFSNIPAGFTFTTQGLGTAATGSDANPATGRTATIALAVGQTNLDVDAGIRSMMAGTASIGNRVWNDLNNNGLQDANEPGIQGVTVELLDGNGNPIDSDPATAGVQPTIRVTNALGEYLFTDLPAGDYKVRFSTLPAGYNASPKAAGTNRDIDSDGNPIAAGSSTTDVISVASGEERLDIDFGLFNPTAPTGQIGDYVWFDSNNNGVQDAGEQGVPGVTVSLLNASNTVIATTVTDGNGNYRFVNLVDATYSVKFSNLPAGFVFSPKDLGGNDNLDSDADPVTGQTGTYTITAGNTNLTVDAGIYSTRAALGDYVWFDANKDGTQDAGEKGIAGVTVTVYDAANVAITSTITDQNGRYFFSNLNPGTYTVGFGTIPTQLVFTIKDAVVAGDLADSDVDPATGKTGPVTLTAGQVNLTVDAGLKPVVPASIGDFVWLDLDRDGIQDANEPGVPGIVVTLYNSANQPIGSAVTDGNGAYLISNVPPGTGYYVVFSNKPDATAPWTLQNVGGVAANNNSKADATGKTAPFNVAEGQNITNMDAGLHKKINIYGNVWHDSNGLDDFQINNSGAALTPVPVSTLFIYLVDRTTGIIVRTGGINVDGTYKFLDVDVNFAYKIVLSTDFALPGSALPASFMPSNWNRVGEHDFLDPNSDDGTPDGMLDINTGTQDVIEANFGIRLGTGEVVIG